MACDIEGGMNRVAGARMVQREFEQRSGRQAGAGPAEPDARRRQVAQIPQRTGRRRRRFHCRAYSAGTDASRSRIE